MAQDNGLKKLSVTLNNYLHRIDCKTTMGEFMAQNGCSIKRIRRSKNWQLTGKHKDLSEISKKLRQIKPLWIADAIDKTLPKPSFDLAQIIKSTPTITINQLVSETGCTLTEARSAIDMEEGFI